MIFWGKWLIHMSDCVCKLRNVSVSIKEEEYVTLGPVFWGGGFAAWAISCRAKRYTRKQRACVGCRWVKHTNIHMHAHYWASLTPLVLRLRWPVLHFLHSSSSQKDYVYQTFTGMLNQASGAHTRCNTQQHSAPVSNCQRRERDTVNHTGQHSKVGGWEVDSKQFISKILFRNKKKECFA